MHLTTFIHQKSYEHIVYQVRRDGITFVPGAFVFALLLAVPAVFYFAIVRTYPQLLLGPISYPLLVLAASVYTLSVLIFFYTYFVTFYLDLLVITNDRLLFVKQISLFARTVSEADLYKIQDVTSEVKGVFPSIFHYGRLKIQTAGAQDEFIVENIPNPEGLRQAILDLAEEDRKHHTQVQVVA